MIITSYARINSCDLGRFAWSELRRFHNVNLNYEIHTRINNVPKRYKNFALKQAKQIKYCLVQAREYATAAEQVSLSTKPVLLYYSCMSLALAEILMKQSGESRLDMARATHNHHGLILRIDEETIRKNHEFQLVASAMRAEPMIRLPVDCLGPGARNDARMVEPN